MLNFHGPFNTAAAWPTVRGVAFAGAIVACARNPQQAESKINSKSKLVFFMRSSLNLSSLSVTEGEAKGRQYLPVTNRREAPLNQDQCCELLSRCTSTLRS